MPPKKTDKKTLQSQQDLTQPYVCTGHFQNDFSELCRRKGMQFAPEVLMRPKPHSTAPHSDVKETKKGKEDKKQKADVAEEQPELDEYGNPLPKTFAIAKNKYHYLKPCVQVEMDNPEKADTVTEMYIRAWKIDSAMLEILQQCWLVMERLSTLSLWNVAMDSDGLFTLAKCLMRCPTVKTLIFDGNVIPEQNYFELISEGSQLAHVSLRHCAISDVGASKIGACLGSETKGKNGKLQSLNLAGNHIGYVGATAIADGLQLNRTLIFLSLSANKISDAGAQRFAQVLSRTALSETQIRTRRQLRLERLLPTALNADRSKSVSPVSKRSVDSKIDSARPVSVRSNAAEKDRSNSKSRDKSSARTNRADAGKSSKDEKNASKKKEEKQEKLEKGKKEKSGLDSRSPDRKGDASSRTGRGTKAGRSPSKTKFEDNTETIDDMSHSPLLEEVEASGGSLWLRGNFNLINLNLSRNSITEEGLTHLLQMVRYQVETLSNLGSNGKQHNGQPGLLRLVINHNLATFDNPVYSALQDAMLSRDPLYKPSATDDALALPATSRENTASARSAAK